MASKKGKGNNTAMKTKLAKPIGEMVKLMNMGPNENFCAFTGKKLPRNGMVVKFDDKLFLNRGTAQAYERTKDA